MSANTEITAEIVRDRLDYDSDTGILTWRRSDTMSASWNTRWAGKPAGTRAISGKRTYISIIINKCAYRAHRLAWLLVYGSHPLHDVDHVDGNGLNNRIDNLRDVTRGKNNENSALAENNTSGCTGVYWHKLARKWACQAKQNGKMFYGGLFTDKDDAIAAAKSLRNELGFHENHGKTREARRSHG